MNYKYCVMSLVLGITGLFMNNATADCLSSIMPQKDGILTWSDLAKYDHCLKAEKTTPNRPLTLSQDTWAAACSGGSFTDNKCFGDDPSTNANTKLVLQVTNIYAVANFSIDDTYPAGSIWIGRYPAGTYGNYITSPVQDAAPGTQLICGAFTEIGWPDTVNISYSGTSSAYGNVAAISNPGGLFMSTQITMLNSASPGSYDLRTPLYIICVARNTLTHLPAKISATDSFEITWALANEGKRNLFSSSSAWHFS